MTRRRLGTVLGALFALAALAVGVVASSSGSSSTGAGTAAQKKGFKAKSLKGKWTGSWNNTTFGSTGSILANVRFKDGKLMPQVDFSGNVFGCQDPPADVVTIKKGKGANRHNKDGFRVNAATKAFGRLKIKYNHKTHAFTGSGSAPPCNPSITYKLKGKLSSKKFTATVTIDLGAQQATSKLSAKKK